MKFRGPKALLDSAGSHYKRNELFPTLRIALVGAKTNIGYRVFLDNGLIRKHLAEFVLQFLG